MAILFRAGCGCVVIPISKQGTPEKNFEVYLVEHCAGDEGLSLRYEKGHIMQHNLESMKPLDVERELEFMAKLTKLVGDGYRVQTIKRALANVGDE